jgi:hypothetical protein
MKRVDPMALFELGRSMAELEALIQQAPARKPTAKENRGTNHWFRMCCLCFNQAMATKDKSRANRWMKLHQKYAKSFAHAAAHEKRFVNFAVIRLEGVTN